MILHSPGNRWVRAQDLLELVLTSGIFSLPGGQGVLSASPNFSSTGSSPGTGHWGLGAVRHNRMLKLFTPIKTKPETRARTPPHPVHCGCAVSRGL